MRSRTRPSMSASTAIGSDGPLIPADGAMPAKDKLVEATKTEPDKNTYLVLDRRHRPGQGLQLRHALPLPGPRGRPARRERHPRGSLTRINLDANLKHRVTLMADADVSGKPLPLIDGSAWDPFAKVLLLTSETGTTRRRLDGDDRLPVEGHRHLGHHRPRLLRRRAVRRRRQCLAGRRLGRLGRQLDQERQAAELLHLPLRPEVPRRSEQGRQAAGAAGARPVRQADRVPRRQGQ